MIYWVDVQGNTHETNNKTNLIPGKRAIRPAIKLLIENQQLTNYLTKTLIIKTSYYLKQSRGGLKKEVCLVWDLALS